MRKEIIKPICATVLVITGLIGVYFKVEYSGWVIFAGAMYLYVD